MYSRPWLPRTLARRACRAFSSNTGEFLHVYIRPVCARTVELYQAFALPFTDLPEHPFHKHRGLLLGRLLNLLLNVLLNLLLYLRRR